MLGLVCATSEKSDDHSKSTQGRLSIRDDLPKPIPGPDEVLVQVSHCGVCGTDLHIMSGEFPINRTGNLVLGHELTGWLADGSPVFVNPNGQCGYCANCQSGLVHFCHKTLNTGAVGIARNGGWAEWVTAPVHQVYRLPPGLPLDVGILIEPLSCVLHGLDKICATRQIDTTDSVLILGAGIIGLLWASVFHQRGVRAIDVCDVISDRRKAVENLRLSGVHPREPDDLPKSTYQVLIDCTGVPKALEAAYWSLDSGGTICVFGCAPEGKKLSLPFFDLVKREITIIFCRINQFTSGRSIALTERLYCDGYLDLLKLGVKLFDLKDFVKAFETLESRQVPKVAFCLANQFQVDHQK